MEALKTSGVLSRVRLAVAEATPPGELDETVHAVCGLLTLVYRTPVAIVGEHWRDPVQRATLSRYREPPFLYASILPPMVSSEQVGEFLEVAYGPYVSQWRDWDLPNAVDHYVQAHALNSAWAQAVGFFTALETLKEAFLAQDHNRRLERYLPARQFKRRKIASTIMGVLEHGLRDSVDLSKADRDSLRGKVGELNRRAYKQILKSMFKELGVAIADSELRQLNSLRNQIIHRGSPDCREGPWADQGEAYRLTARFAGLVEETIMAVLGYHGRFERYDQSLMKRND